MLEIDMEPIQGILCVRLSGKLSKNNISKLNDEVIFLLKYAKVKNLVLNIKDLDYIDFYGKRAIINSFQICHLNNGNGFLCLNDNQRKLLDVREKNDLKVITDEFLAVNFINS